MKEKCHQSPYTLHVINEISLIFFRRFIAKRSTNVK